MIGKRFRITLITPVYTGLIADAIDALMAALIKAIPESYIVPVVYGSRTQDIFQIVVGNSVDLRADLLITFGYLNSKFAIESLYNLKARVPHLFIGCGGSAQSLAELVAPANPLCTNSTGTAGAWPNMAEVAQFLRDCKPEMKKILIPILGEQAREDSGKKLMSRLAYNEKKSALLDEYIMLFAQRGLTLQPVISDGFELLIRKVRRALKTADGIMLANRFAHASVLLHRIKIPEGKFLCVFDIDKKLVSKGVAALGYDFDFEVDPQVPIITEYARKILRDGVHPLELHPVVVTPRRKFYANLDVALEQGFDTFTLKKVVKKWNGYAYFRNKLVVKPEKEPS